MTRLSWLALVVLAVLPYVRAAGAPLVYDDRTLLDNRWLVREAGPASVFQHDYWYGTRHAGSDLYRPLTILSLAWNMHALPSKEGMRGVNVALHAVAVLLAWVMLGAIVSSEAAWIGAALFAVHPLGSEAVLWAVGRAEILAAICGLAAFVLLVKGKSRPLAAAAFLAALCFKESALAWLAVGAAWFALAAEARPRTFRSAASSAAPFLAAAGVYAALRAAAVGWVRYPPPFIDNPLAAVDPLTRAVNAVLLFGRYLVKMALPGALSVEYGFDQLAVVPAWPWGVPAAVVLAAGIVVGIVVLHRRGHRTAAFLAAFVPAAFVVTANLAFPIGTIFAERLAYTPLLGACGLLGLALASIPRLPWRRVAVAALLTALGTRTVVRCGDFASAATLAEATVAASPRSVKALFNAGRTRLRQGDAAGGTALLRQAVAIWPEYAGAWRALAEAYGAQGDAAAAAEARSRAESAARRPGAADEPL